MLKETEIRPQISEKIVNKLRLKDIQTHFSNEKYFTKVNCPACSKDNRNIEFVKEGFFFRRCKRCNTLYVSPRPQPDRLLKYYKDSKSIEFFTKEILEKTAKIRKEKIFKPRAEKIIFYINKFNPLKRLFVEIGGGNGLFLEVVKEIPFGFKKYLNIEPSIEGAKLTEKRGFYVINDFVENVRDLKADCICAFELIEHIFDPFNFLVHIRKLLNKNGIFIISTPNIEGFDLLLLGKNSDNVAAPNHLNYFNPKSIQILLEKAGYTICALETPGELDVDIIKNKYIKGYKLKDRFISFLLDNRQDTLKNFQNFLQINKLSSHMLVVAKRQEDE